MTKLRPILLIILLLATCFVGFNTYQQEQEKIELKNDLIELSKIKYGLFNVDEWKVLLADIISKKIEEFNLDDTNRDEMRVKISDFLTTAIDELEDRYYEEKSNSITGWFESGIASLTGTFGKIKKDIPIFTEQILDFLNDPENREAIRKYLVDKLNEYSDNTFSKTDYSAYNQIQYKYAIKNSQGTKDFLSSSIQEIESNIKPLKNSLILIAIATLLLIVLTKGFKRLEFIPVILIGLAFLLMGVFLPMIEIDARISEMTFTLLGEEVQFKNQVLYYKSKSILEVVQLMFSQNRINLIAVGFLVLAFSVLLPVSKIISSVFYIQSPKLKDNRFIKFMIFKSGKWSMADVMVIAIFMAYIGFDGIISEQLRQLEGLSKSIELLATNQSNLLFGFFAFTIFVLLSLFTSQKIQSTEINQS